MLRIEPSEAENVLLPVWHGEVAQIEALGGLLDDLYRSGTHDRVLELADKEILGKGLGLAQAEIAIIRDAVLELRQRRCRGGLSA